MNSFNLSEEKNDGYEESIAETLSLEIQRDSRRYSADFEN